MDRGSLFNLVWLAWAFMALVGCGPLTPPPAGDRDPEERPTPTDDDGAKNDGDTDDEPLEDLLGTDGNDDDTTENSSEDPTENPTDENAPSPSNTAIRKNRIEFCQGGDKSLFLDIAYPEKGEGPYPAIVFVHGGGWRSGSRDTFREDIGQAATRNYVAVSIDYRLATDFASGEFMAMVEDVKCAVRWLRGNREQYKINAEQIGLMGKSAGAHLALLAGLTDEGQFEGTGGHAQESSEVQAIVNWYGPTDMREVYVESSNLEKSLLAAVLGGTPGQKAELYAQASPVSHATSGDPPVLTAHGTTDKTVPLAHAEALEAALVAANIPHDLEVVQGQGHGFTDDALAKAKTSMWQFFYTNLQ